MMESPHHLCPFTQPVLPFGMLEVEGQSQGSVQISVGSGVSWDKGMHSGYTTGVDCECRALEGGMHAWAHRDCGEHTEMTPEVRSVP